MRCAIPHPCMDSRASVLRMSRSSVPWSRSDDGGMFPLTFDKRMNLSPVECQGEDEWIFGASSQRVSFVVLRTKYGGPSTALRSGRDDGFFGGGGERT